MQFLSGTNGTVTFARNRKLLRSQLLAQYAVAMRSAASESKDILSLKCATRVCSRAVAESLKERLEISSSFMNEAAVVVPWSCIDSFLNPSLCLDRAKSAFERLPQTRVNPDDVMTMASKFLSWKNESATFELVEDTIRAARVAYSDCVFSLECRRLVRRRLDGNISGFLWSGFNQLGQVALEQLRNCWMDCGIDAQVTTAAAFNSLARMEREISLIQALRLFHCTLIDCDTLLDETSSACYRFQQDIRTCVH